jgi:hypothetical protein
MRIQNERIGLKRANQLKLVGEVERHFEATSLLKEPGMAVLVRRGVLRSLVIACPDNCGEVLTVNLDARTGPAWRLTNDKRGTSLYPSVWRETGCRSHFIVWRNRIYWCDWRDDVMDAEDSELEERVLAALPVSLTFYVRIADEMGEEPWAVLVALSRLARRGSVAEGSGKQRGHFRRR